VCVVKRLRIKQDGSANYDGEKVGLIYLDDRFAGQCVLDPEAWEEFQKIAAARNMAVDLLEAEAALRERASMSQLISDEISADPVETKRLRAARQEARDQ
jgi:hypothetical protein